MEDAILNNIAVRFKEEIERKTKKQLMESIKQFYEEKNFDKKEYDELVVWVERNVNEDGTRK